MLEVHAHVRAPGVSLEVPDERGDEPEIVQHGRSQVEGQIADTRDQVRHQLGGRPQIGTNRAVWTSPALLQGELQPREKLADLVVKLPSDMAPLRFLHVDQASRESPQPLPSGARLVAQAGLLERHRQRLPHVDRDLDMRCGESVRPIAREVQRSHQLSVDEEGDPQVRA